MKNLRLERVGYFPKVTELTNGIAGIQTLFFSDSRVLITRIPANDMKASLGRTTDRVTRREPLAAIGGLRAWDPCSKGRRGKKAGCRRASKFQSEIFSEGFSNRTGTEQEL